MRSFEAAKSVLVAKENRAREQRACKQSQCNVWSFFGDDFATRVASFVQNEPRADVVAQV